jgi:hypothetical protein
MRCLNKKACGTVDCRWPTGRRISNSVMPFWSILIGSSKHMSLRHSVLNISVEEDTASYHISCTLTWLVVIRGSCTWVMCCLNENGAGQDGQGEW